MRIGQSLLGNPQSPFYYKAYPSVVVTVPNNNVLNEARRTRTPCAFLADSSSNVFYAPYGINANSEFIPYKSLVELTLHAFYQGLCTEKISFKKQIIKLLLGLNPQRKNERIKVYPILLMQRTNIINRTKIQFKLNNYLDFLLLKSLNLTHCAFFKRIRFLFYFYVTWFNYTSKFQIKKGLKLPALNSYIVYLNLLLFVFKLHITTFKKLHHNK